MSLIEEGEFYTDSVLKVFAFKTAHIKDGEVMEQIKVRIDHRELESGRRILVTSDIHGCRLHLENILKEADFTTEDILIVVGDMIEKGPDSLGTLRYIMKLYEGGNVIPLIGNVDALRLQIIEELCPENVESFYQYLLELRKWKGTSFYDELARECGFVIESPEDLLRSKEKVIIHFGKEFSFLVGLPTVVETQKFVFVHGGLPQKEPEENLHQSFRSLTKVDCFMTSTPHHYEKYVVVGHWPVSLYNSSIQQMDPIIDRQKHIISIDGGCGIKRNGQLNLLVIPDINCRIDELYNYRYDEFPWITALDSQEASVDSINIDWGHSEIRMLEKGEEFSRVEHIGSGRRLDIPNSFLYGNKCYEYTDYQLKVTAGERLKLISQTSRGCVAKKDGVVGWYCGRQNK